MYPNQKSIKSLLIYKFILIYGYEVVFIIFDAKKTHISIVIFYTLVL